MPDSLFPIPAELLRMWPDVKVLYKKVINNAYSHPDDRETAHNVLLRLLASGADILLQDDPQAGQILAHLARTSSTESSIDTNANENSRDPNDGNPQLQPEAETERVPAPAPLDHLDFAGLAGLVGLSGLSGGPTGPSLNAQELQQMFSFMAPGLLSGRPERGDEHDADRRRANPHDSERYEEEFYDN